MGISKGGGSMDKFYEVLGTKYVDPREAYEPKQRWADEANMHSLFGPKLFSDISFHDSSIGKLLHSTDILHALGRYLDREFGLQINRLVDLVIKKPIKRCHNFCITTDQSTLTDLDKCAYGELLVKDYEGNRDFRVFFAILNNPTDPALEDDSNCRIPLYTKGDDRAYYKSDGRIVGIQKDFLVPGASLLAAAPASIMEGVLWSANHVAKLMLPGSKRHPKLPQKGAVASLIQRVRNLDLVAALLDEDVFLSAVTRVENIVTKPGVSFANCSFRLTDANQRPVGQAGELSMAFVRCDA